MLLSSSVSVTVAPRDKSTVTGVASERLITERLVWFEITGAALV
ncbi:hypothetical protein [Streptococcus suis]|nr:hypothetical protein [Streptococcus suis]MCQ9226474.1 hypothetical protein [Streptococcus suis]MCQ9228129.1 hypothetical protein [Streptococcus suis]MDW8765090.1 hypothetical protein [Streptococcus suis]